MAFWKMNKDDHRLVTAVLLSFGIIVAFVSIIFRLGSCFEPPVVEPIYGKTFAGNIKDISFITLKGGMAQVLLTRPVRPPFSSSWKGEQYVLVKWRARTMSEDSFAGTSKAVLSPPYDRFYFSIEDNIIEWLKQYHSEPLFISEYRNRIILHINRIDLTILHPETDQILGGIAKEYDPGERHAYRPDME